MWVHNKLGFIPNQLTIICTSDTIQSIIYHLIHNSSGLEEAIDSM